MENDIPKEFQKYIVTDLPKYVEVEGHHQPAPFWISPEMFPSVHLRIAGMYVSKNTGTPHADPHTHQSPEIYLCASENKGAITVEIQMDDKTFTLGSPFAVFIPAEVKHRFIVLQCDSPHYVFAISLQGWRP